MKTSSFDPARLVFAVAKCTDVDWTGLGLLNTGCPYSWETGDVLDLSEGQTTVLFKYPLHVNVTLPRRALLARSVRFAFNQLLSMNEARARIFGPDAASGSASHGMYSDSCDDKLKPYPDEDDGDV